MQCKSIGLQWWLKDEQISVPQKPVVSLTDSF